MHKQSSFRFNSQCSTLNIKYGKSYINTHIISLQVHLYQNVEKINKQNEGSNTYSKFNK